MDARHRRGVTENRTNRPATLRRIWAAVTIGGCVPYVVLKVCWIVGLPVGWIDPAVTHGSAYLFSNVSTLALDAVVVVLVITLVGRWGQRIPGWLLLVPVWIGTGLLVPIPLTMGVSALLNPWAGAAGTSVVDNAVLAAWVPVVVYGGFTVQGIGLLGCFALYARDRWSRLFVIRMRDRRFGPASGLLMIITTAGALVGILVAMAMGVLAFLNQDGDPQRLLIDRTGAVITVIAVTAGSSASVALASCRTRGDRWLATSMIISWVGVAVLFAGSCFGLLGQLITGELTLVNGLPLTPLLQLAGLIAGLLMGLVGAITLAENGGQSEGRTMSALAQSSRRGETGQSSG